jgi:nicotinamidase-related amidase
MRIENGEIVGAAINLADGSTTDIGTFHTVRPSFQKWAMSYLKALTDGNRYPHCVWPRHCIIGTPGHTVIPPMMEALLGWEDLCTGVVNKVTKGSNIHVEHFSAVRAEVPHPDDPHTQLNSDFVDAVMDASTILLSGIAGSHCLANTVRDVADEFAGADDVFIKKAILLEDGTAPVPGFEAMQTQFIDDMVARGMKKTTCANFLA